MAPQNITVGKRSELLAASALLSNGYEGVAYPITDEPYDIIARNPITKTFETFQVKTARIREDKGNAIVIYAKKGDGTAYTREEIDYILGVIGDDVYLIENRGIGEYWASPRNISQKWRKLTE